jgi:hypothetical protein
MINHPFSFYVECDVANIFANHLHRVDCRFTVLVMVGVFIVICSFWLSENDMGFNDIFHYQQMHKLCFVDRSVHNRDIFTKMSI